MKVNSPPPLFHFPKVTAVNCFSVNPAQENKKMHICKQYNLFICAEETGALLCTCCFHLVA